MPDWRIPGSAFFPATILIKVQQAKKWLPAQPIAGPSSRASAKIEYSWLK
jgi:hypothetical protein